MGEGGVHQESVHCHGEEESSSDCCCWVNCGFGCGPLDFEGCGPEPGRPLPWVRLDCMTGQELRGERSPSDSVDSRFILLNGSYHR